MTLTKMLMVIIILGRRESREEREEGGEKGEEERVGKEGKGANKDTLEAGQPVAPAATDLPCRHSELGLALFSFLHSSFMSVLFYVLYK